MLRLRAAGRLALSDPLDKHLPGTPAGHLTVGALLSHTGGLTSEPPGPWWERTPGTLRPELADIFQDQPQVHEPGQRHHYSNPGYALLDDWDNAYGLGLQLTHRDTRLLAGHTGSVPGFPGRRLGLPRRGPGRRRGRQRHLGPAHRRPGRGPAQHRRRPRTPHPRPLAPAQRPGPGPARHRRALA
ncbi:serine hydrolase domain-containing protein [Actinoplanes sp. N902-109]|uniref:serine hydrolase n=1 Tax=Actinoplanes sp. (strain N902-109) TaxID=649831 RepID=UPI001E50BBCF|nr:serine hydrolase domain-containing protein [Actinoplanes sp. N902-109]